MPDPKSLPDSYLPYLLDIRGELEIADFHVGSGVRLSISTDAPVLRNDRGQPYLPASSLRGIMRAHVTREAPFLVATHHDYVLSLFGQTPYGDEKLVSRASRLHVYDADPEDPETSVHTEVRDHVKIDQKFGAAEAKAKFDQEVAATAALRFRLIYEGDSANDSELSLVGEIIRALHSGELSCGAKGSLAYGRLHLTGTRYAGFDRTSPEGLAAWLESRSSDTEPVSTAEFTWPTRLVVSPCRSESALSRLDLDIRIQFEGPVLVRAPIPPKPSAEPFDVRNRALDVEKGVVTADQTFVRTGPASAPRYYLPAASIRGVLRHQASRIAATMFREQGPILVSDLFGDVSAGIATKGHIEIAEGRLDGTANPVYLDHVAIDRLTGFAADSKKFSTCGLQSPAFNTSLRLRFDPTLDAAGNRPFLRRLALAAFVIRDWLDGMLWCGGATSRGYGYMKSVSITRSTLDWVVQDRDGLPESFLPGIQRDSRPGHIVVSLPGAIPWESWLWGLASAPWLASLPATEQPK